MGRTLSLVALDKRIDLDERAILLDEEVVELLHHLLRLLLHLCALETKLVGNRIELLRCEPLLDINGDLEDGIGVLLRQGLDVCAALGASDHDRAVVRSVHEDGKVCLTADEQSLSKVDLECARIKRCAQVAAWHGRCQRTTLQGLPSGPVCLV